MKFSELTKTSRLNEGSGKFNWDPKHDPSFGYAETTITIKDKSMQGLGDSEIYVSCFIATPEHDGEYDLGVSEIYCEIKNYRDWVGQRANDIIAKLSKYDEDWKGALNYLKSL